jgi:hypothetical protein
MSRRTVLAAGLATVAASVMASESPSAGAATSARPTGGARRGPAVPSLGRSAFGGVVGTTFTVHTSGRTRADVLLTDVGPLSVGHPTEQRFSLVFEGSARTPFNQGTYPVQHPQLGSFDLFLVPVGPTGAVQPYQAIFNS